METAGHQLPPPLSALSSAFRADEGQYRIANPRRDRCRPMTVASVEGDPPVFLADPRWGRSLAVVFDQEVASLVIAHDNHPRIARVLAVPMGLGVGPSLGVVSVQLHAGVSEGLLQ